MVNSPAALIDAKGGPAAFARSVGIKPAAARVYKHRNRLPRTIWGNIITVWPDVTLDDLQRMQAA